MFRNGKIWFLEMLSVLFLKLKMLFSVCHFFTCPAST